MLSVKIGQVLSVGYWPKLLISVLRFEPCHELCRMLS